jgi:hypothetical protein
MNEVYHALTFSFALLSFLATTICILLVSRILSNQAKQKDATCKHHQDTFPQEGGKGQASEILEQMHREQGRRRT